MILWYRLWPCITIWAPCTPFWTVTGELPAQWRHFYYDVRG